MDRWSKVVLLCVGGAAGVNARYWLGVWISRWARPGFPWATFWINVTGCFAIGLIGVLLAEWLPHPNLRLLLVVGFLGGYTTFSSYAYETLTLAERGEWTLAALYSAGSVVLGLIAVFAGTAIGRLLRLGS